MSLLITHMWLCLLLAFALGWIACWLLLARPLRARLEEQDASWSKKYKVLSADRDKFQSKAAGLAAEIEPLQTSVSSLEKDLAAARTDVTERTSDNERLGRELATLQSTRDSLAADVARLENTVTAQTTDAEVLRASLRDAEAERDTVDQDRKKLETERSDLAVKLDGQISSFAALETQAGNDRSLVEQLRADLAAASSEHESLSGEINTLKEALASASRERDDIKVNAEQLGRDKQLLAGDLEDARDAETQVRQELAGARKRVPQLESQVIDREKRLEANAEELREIRTRASETEKTLAALRDESAQQRSTLASMSESLEAAKAELAPLRGSLSERDQRIAQLMRDLNACRTGREELEARLAKATEKPVVPAYGLKAPVGRADDLKRVKGIGPKLEGILHGLGIFHFRQIANFTLEDIAWVSKHLAEFKGRIERDDWLVQAAKLHRADYNENP